MKPRKIVAGLLVLVFLMSSAAPALAAKKKKAKKPAGPITIVADELYFSDKTGELFGKGNVVITQDKSIITADVIRGNEKQTELWVDDKARLRDPLTNITGMKLRYNYEAKSGTMRDIKGKCGDDFISGKNIQYEEGKITAYGATTTGCPAQKTPDYRVTARKVEIWPEDKMIAYDAKVWIKNFVIYTTPRYKKSLKRTDDEETPSFGYRDPDGYWIKQHLNYPLTDELSLRTDLYYYTVKGFKPTIDALYEQKDYSFQVSVGDYSNATSSTGDVGFGASNTVNWVKKSPEFKFDWHAKPVGKLPWKYSFSALIGQWTDDTKTSWHHDYYLYFTRDPIYFDKKKTWTWTNGWGLEQIRESYNGSVQNMVRYNTSISKQLAPWLRVWTGYNYTNNNQSAFAYSQINVAQEWYNGIYVQIDRLNAVSFVNSYDLTNHQTYENYYTYYRNLHCWNFYIQYKAKAKQWVWELTVLRF